MSVWFVFQISSVLSFLFTLLNVLVIMVIIGIGIFHADGRNWTDPPGFFPKGFRGVCSYRPISSMPFCKLQSN